MKTTLLNIIFSSIFFNCLLAQISVVHDTTFFINHVGYDDVGHGFVINNSNMTLNSQWTRILNNVQQGTSAICDVNVCHEEETNFAQFELDMTTQGTMDAHFKSVSYNTDTSVVALAIFDPADSLNTVVIATYIAIMSPISSSFASYPVVHPLNDDSAISSAYIKNHGTTDTVNLTWELDTLNPIIGYAEICINGSCESVSGAASLVAQILPGDSLEVSGKFLLNGMGGEGVFTINFFDDTDPEFINVRTTFYAKAKWSTGIENINNNIVSIYPNPAKNNITIEKFNEIEFIHIFDMLGNFIKVIPSNSSSYKEIIDITDYHTGIYSIRLSDIDSHLIGVSRFSKY